ncbi:hypothetical protein KUL152_01320 [Tenacibaculum sp. KUL152]|nr:hypothetical protein KUL152_01320 [Tenacibaculum sp. KUL152]
MPIWFKCFRLISIIALLFLALASHGARSDESTTATPQKINEYADLLHKVIYDWNYPSALSNEVIEQQIIKSGVQQDESSIGVIFRHLMALSTAETGEHARVPVYVKQPLLNKHWQVLEKAAPKTYAYTHGYYIYVQAANDYKGSSRRVDSTIPELIGLKEKLLRIGDKEAVAIASMWLAMEYSESAPLRAISEIEYALPHLPDDSANNALESELGITTALSWLSSKYMELNIPSKSYEYVAQLIEIKRKRGTLKAWDYSYAVIALLSLNQYSSAMTLAEEAKSMSLNDTPLQGFIARALELAVLIKQYDGENSDLIIGLANELSNYRVDSVPVHFADIKPYAKAVKLAFSSDTKNFNIAIDEYKKVMQEQESTITFSRQIGLKKYPALRDIYYLKGDMQKAFLYEKKYKDVLIAYNTEQFNLSDRLETSSLSKDIELAQYKQRELEALLDEKAGLTSNLEQLQLTIFALVVTIFGILSMWLWLTKKQNASSSQFDSLTGALTRRAMLNSLKKALKRDSSSCVALLDIDKFKRINEKFGHEVGDEVLATFSQTIRGRIRKSDKLCRYGNEEFLIYFTDSNESHVKRVLDELNQSLSKLTLWKHTNERFAVSFSSGVLKVNGDANLDTVIQCCDKLLQTAKQKGHSQIETYALSVC